MHECDSSRDAQAGRDLGVDNRSSRRAATEVNGFSGWPSPPLPSRPRTFAPADAEFTIRHAPSAPAAIFRSAHVIHSSDSGNGSPQQFVTVECCRKDESSSHLQPVVEDGGIAVDVGGRDFDASNGRAQRCQVWFRPVNGGGFACSQNEGSCYGDSLSHANSFPLTRSHGRQPTPPGPRSESAVGKHHHDALAKAPSHIIPSPKDTGRNPDCGRVHDTGAEANIPPRRSMTSSASDELLKKGLLLEHEALHPDTYSDTQVLVDIDDTVRSSGGVTFLTVNLGGVDTQYARGHFYPGCFQFIFETSNFGCRLPKRPLSVGVLTARIPQVPINFDNPINTNLRMTAARSGVRDWGIDCNTKILYSTLNEWLFPSEKGRRKFENLRVLDRKMSAFKPSIKYIWVGDTGEFDRVAGEMMATHMPSKMRAVFLHLVGEETRRVKPPSDYFINGVPIVFFRTFVRAARRAYDLGLLGRNGLSRVIVQAVQDLERMKAPSLSTKWRDVIIDVRDAEKVLPLDEAVVKPLVRTREIIRRRMIDLQRSMARLKRPPSGVSGGTAVDAAISARVGNVGAPEEARRARQGTEQSSVMQAGGKEPQIKDAAPVTSNCDVFSNVINHQSSGGCGRLPAQPSIPPANRRYRDAKVLCEGSQGMPWRVVEPSAGCESADSDGETKALSAALRTSEKRVEKATSPGVELLDLAPPVAGRSTSSSTNLNKCAFKAIQEGVSGKEAMHSLHAENHIKMVAQTHPTLTVAFDEKSSDPAKPLKEITPPPDAPESEEAALLSEADQNWILSEAQWEEDNSLPVQSPQEERQVENMNPSSQETDEWLMEDEAFATIPKSTEAAENAQ